jgi:hypothetical protein
VKLQEALREIRSLKRKVRSLTKEIDSIKAVCTEDPSPVEKMLKMRGIKVFRKNPTDRLFFPADLSPFHKTRFLEMMKKYSFRLVLRDMIKYQDGFRVQDLTRYCSPRVVQGYCDLLCEIGAIIKNGRGRYRTRVSPLYSFGPTLEWFIAGVFQREFASPAIYGVSVKNTPSGGDYDVISLVAGYLVYVEVKSSPPRGVEHQAVQAFLGRLRDLEPSIAVLFVDTELRMRDKLVPLLAEGLELEGKTGPDWAVVRLVNEIFHVRHSVYVINSRKGIYSNLRTCFRDFLRGKAGHA